MTNDELFKGYGVEIRLAEDDDFLKVKETLTRMGIASNKNKRLYQSCHILHKQGKYAILHFKELFALDGKFTDLSDDDIARRNRIVKLLSDWGLVTIIEPEDVKEMAPISNVKILPHKEKAEWELVSKYTVGKKKIG